MFSIFHVPRRYPRIYSDYYNQFNFYEGRETWLETIENIPEEAVYLFSIHWLHLEVYNGGFWQYFFNSTCISMPEAIHGFSAIGMNNVSVLVEEASSKVGNPFPFDEEKRREIVGGPDERMDFEDCTDRFYELADTNKFFRRKPKFVDFAEDYADKIEAMKG